MTNRMRLIQRGVQIHDPSGGYVSHALFEFFRNPRIVGFDYKFSHLRPLIQWQGFDLLNDVLCAHLLSFAQKFFFSKRRACGSAFPTRAKEIAAAYPHPAYFAREAGLLPWLLLLK